MSDGRTFWWAKDAGWYDREAVVILGDEFGAEGTTVLDVLSCQAKLENDGGRVKTGYASLTKKGNISAEETTRRIVARAAEIGALDDFSENRITFTARVSGWKADQDLARAAVRQDRHRQATAAQARDTTEPGVTDRDEASPTAQNNTAEKEKPNGIVEPRLDEIGQQVSELFAYWQERCGHPHAKLTPKRRRKIAGRLREKYTPEYIREAIDKAVDHAYTNPEGTTFDDIELICRSGEKLEDFHSRGENPPAAGSTSSGPDGPRPMDDYDQAAGL